MNYNRKALEDLYNQVAGKPVPLRKHLRVFGEDIDLYTSTNGEYTRLGSVDDSDFKKIQKLVAGGSTGEIINYLNSKKYDKNSFQNEHDFSSLVDLLDRYHFDEYFKADQKPSLVDVKENNIYNVTKAVGLDEGGARALAQFKPVDNAGSNIGPGEILLAMVFKDVTNSDSGGDLKINSDSLEIKGQGGRFGQQSGRGGVNFSLQPMLDALGENIELPISLKNAISILYQAFTNKKISQKFIPALRKTLEQAYPSADFNHLNNVDYMDAGTHGSIKHMLLKLCFSNYVTKYNYDNVLFINKNTLDYALFDKEDALKNGGLIDTGKLKSDNFTIRDLYPNNYYVFS